MPKTQPKPLIKRTDVELEAFALMTHKRSHPALYSRSLKAPEIRLAKGVIGEFRSVLKKTTIRKEHPLRREIRKKPRFTFIDLFAGIGGFRLAGENCYGKCIFTSEKDKFARISYYRNFGELPFGDINELTRTNCIDQIPDHDVLCGGFPCQAFSISGDQKGFDDERGILFYKIRDILAHKTRVGRPTSVVFLENVRNFRNHGNPKGATFATVKAELEALGYNVFDAILNSGNLGASTKRERVYIVAVLKDKFQDATIELFANEFRKLQTLRHPGEPLRKHLQELRDDQLNSYLIPKDRIVTKHAVLCERDEEACRQQPAQPVQIGQIGKEDDPKKGRQGERIYSIYGHAITFSAYGGGLAARTGAYLIDGKVRKLTPLECARIMGFERCSRNNGGITKSQKSATMDTRKLNELGLSDWQLYKQFGNSVVVPTVEHIYRLISDYFFVENS
jgi:DNA (cytosine-5)-methyltransferase 1